jgi:hypothetical protein
MNEPQEAQSTARDHVAQEPCPCREIVDTVREYLGISPAARRKRTRAILGDVTASAVEPSTY